MKKHKIKLKGYQNREYYGDIIIDGDKYEVGCNSDYYWVYKTMKRYPLRNSKLCCLSAVMHWISMKSMTTFGPVGTITPQSLESELLKVFRVLITTLMGTSGIPHGMKPTLTRLLNSSLNFTHFGRS